MAAKEQRPVAVPADKKLRAILDRTVNRPDKTFQGSGKEKRG